LTNTSISANRAAGLSLARNLYAKYQKDFAAQNGKADATTSISNGNSNSKTN